MEGLSSFHNEYKMRWRKRERKVESNKWVENFPTINSLVLISGKMWEAKKIKVINCGFVELFLSLAMSLQWVGGRKIEQNSQADLTINKQKAKTRKFNKASKILTINQSAWELQWGLFLCILAFLLHLLFITYKDTFYFISFKFHPPLSPLLFIISSFKFA